MKEKLLSIIIPVYNVEAYLERCMKSVETFEQDEVEIILVNDGSTDSSGKLCDKFAGRRNVKVIHKKNGGLSDARNVGLLHATGRYVWFVDSDDAIFPIYLKLRNVLCENQIDVIVLDYVMNQNGHCIEMKHTSLTSDEIYTGCSYLKRVLEKHEYYVPVWSYVFSRDLFAEGKNTFRKGIYHEDEQLMPYLLLSAKTVAALKEKGYQYFVRENSIATNKDWRKNIQDMFTVFGENVTFFEACVRDVQLRKLLLNDIVEKMVYSLCRYRVPIQERKRILNNRFLLKNAYGIKNKIRVILFVCFPQIYQCLFEKNEIRKSQR